MLITVLALDLLSDEELTALVAHELGHEYTWRDWVDARARGDQQRLREIELVSDLIAVATIHRIGKPASVLVSASRSLRKRIWNASERRATSATTRRCERDGRPSASSRGSSHRS